VQRGEPEGLSRLQPQVRILPGHVGLAALATHQQALQIGQGVLDAQVHTLRARVQVRPLHRCVDGVIEAQRFVWAQGGQRHAPSRVGRIGELWAGADVESAANLEAQALHGRTAAVQQLRPQQQLARNGHRLENHLQLVPQRGTQEECFIARRLDMPICDRWFLSLQPDQNQRKPALRFGFQQRQIAMGWAYRGHPATRIEPNNAQLLHLAAPHAAPRDRASRPSGQLICRQRGSDSGYVPYRRPASIKARMFCSLP